MLLPTFLTGPGETISHQLWTGPGAGSFYSTATTLDGVVSQIVSILGGHQATAGALSTAWTSPTGELAVSANSPYEAWLGEAAGHITAAATQIHAAGAAFDAARGMTRTPGEFWALDFQCWQWMLLNPLLLGMLTPLILANRAMWAAWTISAVTGMANYTSASEPVQSLAPLAAPPVSGTAVPPNPSIAAGLAGQQPIGRAMQGVAATALQPLSATAPLLSQLWSQPSNALASSGGQLAQAPAAMTSGLAGLPSMAQAPMTTLGSPTPGSGGLGSGGAEAGSFFGATPGAGGTVAAALSGGSAGVGGVASTALAPMRGPVSWASTANAANPTPDADGVVVSRIAGARAASATPATSAGMGAPGAMMPPTRQASASARERGLNDTLAAAAVLYRPPRAMPVVTGAAGAQFAAGGEEQ
jgi:PPE-repeat protein